MKFLICCLAMFLVNAICLADTVYPAAGTDEKTGKEYDLYQGETSEIKVTFVGHGTLMIENKNKVIHIDPWGDMGDYSKFPKADIILVTHEHFDHFDAKTIGLIGTSSSKIVCTPVVAANFANKEAVTVLSNGEKTILDSVEIEAVPAYNIQHKRDTEHPFHPKGTGNGYILTVDGIKIYVAGDTENIPEMATLKDKNIYIAFLPMNLPYTMDRDMFVEAAKMVAPRFLYPYHTSGTDPKQLEGLENDCGCKVKIRKLE